MKERIVSCSVKNEIVLGAGQVIGAAGSHDDVLLELSFSPMWDGLSKRIVWFDAMGEHPTLTVLTTDLLAPDDPNRYRVPIPAEAKAVDGTIMMTIRGAEVVDGVETRAVITTSATFQVLPAIWDPFASESQDITPSQADQIQAELEAIKDDIVETSSSAKAAKASAEAAAASATAAASSEKTAAQAAEKTETDRESAQTAASAAASSAEAASKAQGAAETAQAAAEAAKEGLEDAQAAAEKSAQAASDSAGAAAGYAQAASDSAKSAEASATTATNAASYAGAAAEAAGTSKTAAEEAASAAASSEQSAAYWAQQAAETVGGDFATNQSVQESINTHNTSSDAHEDLRKTVSDHTDNQENPHGVTAAQIGAIPTSAKGVAGGVAELDSQGKVPSAQLPAMDYVATDNVGKAGGVASLDETGKVPTAQLPEMNYIPTTEKGAASGVATLGEDGKLSEDQRPAASDEDTLKIMETVFSGSGDVGELEDLTIKVGHLTNSGAGWNTFKFPDPFDAAPRVALQPLDFTGWVEVKQVTAEGFLYCLRQPTYTEGSVSTGSYYTASGTSSSSAHSAQTLVNGVTLPTAENKTTEEAIDILWVAIEFNGGDDDAER